MQGVQFTPSDNILALENSQLRLTFSLQNPGSLISISSPLFQTSICESQHAPVDLWRLTIGSFATFITGHIQSFRHEFTHDSDGAGHLAMEWQAPSLEGSGSAVVGVIATLSPTSPLCSLRAWVELPPLADWRLLRFEFPVLTGFSHTLLAESDLVLPIGQGIRVHAPVDALTPDAEWHYPSDLTMQCVALSLPSTGMSVYLAAHDPALLNKSLRVIPRDGGDIAMSLIHTGQPPREDRIAWQYDCVLGLVDGNWQAAAEVYRRWTLQQTWRLGQARRPSLQRLSDSGTPQSQEFGQSEHHGVWFIGTGTGQHVTQSALSLQRELNAPVQVLWQWWHGCPGDSLYPDYLPPRDGGAELTKSLSLLQGAGMSAWLSLDPSAASPNSATWAASGLDAHVAVGVGGEPQATWTNPLSGDTLSAMCSADEAWFGLLTSICGQLKAFGSAGMWLNHCLPEGVQCYSSHHSHLAGTRERATEVLRALQCPAVVSDPSEEWLNEARTVIFSGSSYERFGHPKGIRTDTWEPIPFLQTVYSPNLASVGMIGPLDHQFPFDPLWPQAGHMQFDAARDGTLQLYVEAARTLLWGGQLGLMSFDPLWLREPLLLRKLAFIRMLVQVNGTEPPATRGTYIGPLNCLCQSVDVSFIVNSTYTLPHERRVYMKRIPSVSAAAWKSSARTLIIRENITENPTEFTCVLPVEHSRGHVVSGVTFSPGIGVRPASLASNGTEISGHLPGQSACIVRL